MPKEYNKVSSGAHDGFEPSHSLDDIYLMTSIKINNSEGFKSVIILEIST